MKKHVRLIAIVGLLALGFVATILTEGGDP